MMNYLEIGSTDRLDELPPRLQGWFWESGRIERCWISTPERYLSIFHLCCLRCILGINWSDWLTNAIVFTSAQLRILCTLLQKVLAWTCTLYARWEDCKDSSVQGTSHWQEGNLIFTSKMSAKGTWGWWRWTLRGRKMLRMIACAGNASYADGWSEERKAWQKENNKATSGGGGSIFTCIHGIKTVTPMWTCTAITDAALPSAVEV